jgi:hypothetical protein
MAPSSRHWLRLPRSASGTVRVSVLGRYGFRSSVMLVACADWRHFAFIVSRQRMFGYRLVFVRESLAADKGVIARWRDVARTLLSSGAASRRATRSHRRSARRPLVEDQEPRLFAGGRTARAVQSCCAHDIACGNPVATRHIVGRAVVTSCSIFALRWCEPWRSLSATILNSFSAQWPCCILTLHADKGECVSGAND